MLNCFLPKQSYDANLIQRLLISSLIISLLATNVVYADAKTGAWGEVIEWPHIAVSASNLPDGRVLTWAASERTEWSSHEEKTYSATWNPTTGKFIEIKHPSHNMFCAHQVMTEDGQVFVNGGRTPRKSKWTSLFDHITNTWKQIENMITGGRWYPTTVTMGNGNIFTGMGSGSAAGLKHPELWTKGGGWQVLNGVDFEDMRKEHDGLENVRQWWPTLNITPEGEVFHFWDTQESFFIKTDGTGSYQNAQASTDVKSHTPGVTVNYDVGKLLMTGSNQGSWNGKSNANAFTVDLTASKPVIKATQSMHYKRKYHHLIPLPTGEVLVVGGNSSGQAFSDSMSVLDTEIWNPTTGEWRIAAPLTIPRNYHSTALLLTDGRILTAGGGLTDDPDKLDANHSDAQVYSPPYLFDVNGSLAVRPVIRSGPETIQVGGMFTAKTDQAVDYFSLVKMSSTTHSMNTDARFLKPTFTRTADNTYSISILDNPNVVIPGYWMLFAVNTKGVPSRAHVLRIFRSGQIANPVDTIEIEPISTTPQQSETLSTFSAVAAGEGPFEYHWNFGDGAIQDFSTQATASHRYNTPGQYIIVVTIRDNNGNTGKQTFTQLVYNPRTVSNPHVSSGLIEYVARNQVWNVNPDNNTVTVIDASDFTVVKEILVGGNPRSLAIAADGKVWVVNKATADIMVIDPGSLKVIKTIALDPGSQPDGLVIGKQYAFVALEAMGDIVQLNPSNGQIQARKHLAKRPRHLSLDATESNLLVSQFITPPLPGEDSATPIVKDGIKVYGGEIEILETQNLSVVDTVVLQHSERPISEHTGPGIPNYLGPAVISPDGSSAWVPSKQDNILAGGLRGGFGMIFDQTVRAITSKIDLTSTQEILSSRVDHDNASVASYAAFGPHGLYLFSSLEGNNEVAVTDVMTSTEVHRIAVGRVPQSVLVSEDGSRLYVHNFLDRSLSVHDISALITQGEPSTPKLATVTTVGYEKLSTQILRGKRIFYDATDNRLARDDYMSCASCHNDGDTDGRIWDLTDFGEGLRNTISLKGHAGMAHGPLHWSGNFDEVHDFEGQIRELSGGTGLLSNQAFFNGTRQLPLGDKKTGLSADLDALDAYVSSLKTVGVSPYRQKNGGLTPEARIGKALFFDMCSECHSGRHFTDSAPGVRHNIGTIKQSSGNRLFEQLAGIDTPGLTGTWMSAPYLHDGAAKTVAQAIKAHQDFLLTSDETSQLVAYVQQIDDVETKGEGEQLVFVALSQPCRIVNTGGVGLPFNQTRTEQSFLAWGNSSLLNQQRDQDGSDNLGSCLPENGLMPSAIAANVTVAAKGSQARGNVTTYPFDSTTQGAASLVNFQANNIANSSIITLSPESRKHFKVKAMMNGFNPGGSAQVNVIVDTLGYFYPKSLLAATATPGLGYIPLPQPCRIVNTRNINSPFHSPDRPRQGFLAWGLAQELDTQRDVDGSENLGACLPEGDMKPTAMMANMTVAAKSFKAKGNMVAFKHEANAAAPMASLVNFNANNIANASIIALNPDAGQQHFDVEARIGNNEAGGSKQAHVMIDVQGYFYSQDELTQSAKSGLSYMPLDQPCRIVDTRGFNQAFSVTNQTQGFKAWGTAAELNVQRDQDGSDGLAACLTAVGKTPSAMVANITVAAKTFKSKGNAVAYPADGGVTETSLVNFHANNVANSTILALRSDAQPHFNIKTQIFNHNPGGSKQAHVIVDVIGFFYP